MEERMLQCLNWKPGNMFHQLKVIGLYEHLKKLALDGYSKYSLMTLNLRKPAEFERISTLIDKIVIFCYSSFYMKSFFYKFLHEKTINQKVN